MKNRSKRKTKLRSPVKAYLKKGRAASLLPHSERQYTWAFYTCQRFELRAERGLLKKNEQKSFEKAKKIVDSYEAALAAQRVDEAARFPEACGEAEQSHDVDMRVPHKLKLDSQQTKASLSEAERDAAKQKKFDALCAVLGIVNDVEADAESLDSDAASSTNRLLSDVLSQRDVQADAGGWTTDDDVESDDAGSTNGSMSNPCSEPDDVDLGAISPRSASPELQPYVGASSEVSNRGLPPYGGTESPFVLHSVFVSLRPESCGTPSRDIQIMVPMS